jgi:hypothetical protein
MDFDRVWFGAGIEADGAPGTSRACIFGVFHAFAVEAFRKCQAFLRAGYQATSATLAFLGVYPGEGEVEFLFISRHGEKIS